MTFQVAEDQFMRAIALFSLLASLIAFPALADCVAPQMAPLPKGASANQEEMVAAQKGVKAYHVAVQSYLECAAKTGVDGRTQEQALRALRAVADQFNEELRKYKAKQGA